MEAVTKEDKVETEDMKSTEKKQNTIAKGPTENATFTPFVTSTHSTIGTAVTSNNLLSENGEITTEIEKVTTETKEVTTEVGTGSEEETTETNAGKGETEDKGSTEITTSTIAEGPTENGTFTQFYTSTQTTTGVTDVTLKNNSSEKSDVFEFDCAAADAATGHEEEEEENVSLKCKERVGEMKEEEGRTVYMVIDKMAVEGDISRIWDNNVRLVVKKVEVEEISPK